MDAPINLENHKSSYCILERRDHTVTGENVEPVTSVEDTKNSKAGRIESQCYVWLDSSVEVKRQGVDKPKIILKRHRQKIYTLIETQHGKRLKKAPKNAFKDKEKLDKLAKSMEVNQHLRI